MALAAGLSAALAGAAVLFFFDPATSGFYPQCPLHRLTGLDCPGCGGLRAVHQLLHGHFSAAWRLNPIVFLLPPVGLWLAWREWTLGRADSRWNGTALRPAYGWLAAGALAAFGVWRNLR
jgi:hypothetical protein